MAGRSLILVMVLGLGVLFSLLSFSTILAGDNGKTAHDPNVIPTEPKISQLQALETVEKQIRLYVKNPEVIKLDYTLYNFSSSEYGNEEYRHKLIYGWDVEHIKKYPELLNIPLYFVHANGTTYAINSAGHIFHKVCDQPSPICPMGRTVTDAVRNRLVYYAETAWSPPLPEVPYNYGQYAIDAETGKVAWDGIEYGKNIKPMPNVSFDNKTLSQLFREHANPPQTTNITIERGAAIQSSGKGYLPKETRVTLGIDNKVVWTNSDSLIESVVSDTGYVDKLTGKKFESGQMLPNSMFEFVFTEPGEYSYHAEPHPWMTGKVTVQKPFS